jgi:hypothetical protein
VQGSTQVFGQLGDKPTLLGSSTTPFVADELTDPLPTRKHDTYKKKQAKYLVSTLAIRWHICSIQHVITIKGQLEQSSKTLK